MQDPRSLLFVPGSRPERFDKAIATDADLVCIDLEDAVSPDDKDQARQAVFDFLASPRDRVGVRLNELTTATGVADLNALLAGAIVPSFVMLPKVESEETVRLYHGWLDDRTFILPIVETARGLEAAREIFSAPGVGCGLFGGVDYASDVGCEPGYEGLYAARTRLLNAAAVAQVTLIDVPYTDVHDLDGLAEDTRKNRRLGMRARAAIHPGQLDVIHRALAPTAEEREQARRVVDAFDAAEGRVALLDGKLIELPVIKAARRILATPGDKTNAGEN